MNMDQLKSIFDQTISARDLLVDELSDEIESGCLSGEQLDVLVRDVVAALPTETDLAVRESFMNLLSEAYLQTREQESTDNYIVKHIAEMAPSELVHALAMLADSNIVNRGKHPPGLYSVSEPGKKWGQTLFSCGKMGQTPAGSLRSAPGQWQSLHPHQCRARPHPASGRRSAWPPAG